MALAEARVGMALGPRRIAMLQAMDLVPMVLRATTGRDAAEVEEPGPGTIDFDHPLFAAVWRASGLQPDRPSEFDWTGWARSVQLPALAVLAGDPQAKRRLWRRLRAHRSPPA